MTDTPKFTIDVTPNAERHLKLLRAYDRAAVVDSIADHLQYQTTTETRKCKRLKPNKWAEWELRVGDLRVLYNVEDDRVVVLIIAIGVMDGNRLIIDGEEVEL